MMEVASTRKEMPGSKLEVVQIVEGKQFYKPIRILRNGSTIATRPP